MQGHVCAYCGADVAEAGVDVDHFRPKRKVHDDASHGGYWWLAYEFENYLLGCIVCNQKYKRTKFPLEDGATRARYENRDRLSEERRVLLDPAIDPVEDWISVDWQNPACRLVPNQLLAPDLATRVQRMIELFRLNLKAAQRKKRREIQRLVIEKLAEGKTGEARSLAIRYRPHSVVAKQVLQDTAPHLLPTPREELDWLLETLKSELLDKLEDLNDITNATELDKKEAKELIWALAVLWKDPPVGSPDSVQQFLERNGLKTLVQDYLKEL
jgi:uncharacterized protein (TIGR02646 family)